MEKEIKYREDVKVLKEWYSKQLHLPQNIDEHYYYNAVSGTSSLERAKQKMDAYFSMRRDVMFVIKGINPTTKTYREAIKAHLTAILPEKAPDGYRVLFSAIRPQYSSLYNFSVAFLINFLLGEIAYEMWPIDTEYAMIIDYAGLPMGAVRTMDLRHVIAWAKLTRKGIPHKLKGIYVLKAPFMSQTMMSTIKPVISKKIYDRVHLCQDISELNEILPTSMLPLEYGGEGKSLEELSDYWKELIDSRGSWFEEKMKLHTDESRRPKDSYARPTLDFGVEGFFKSLIFD